MRTSNEAAIIIPMRIPIRLFPEIALTGILAFTLNRLYLPAYSVPADRLYDQCMSEKAGSTRIYDQPGVPNRQVEALQLGFPLPSIAVCPAEYYSGQSVTIDLFESRAAIINCLTALSVVMITRRPYGIKKKSRH